MHAEIPVYGKECRYSVNQNPCCRKYQAKQEEKVDILISEERKKLFLYQIHQSHHQPDSYQCSQEAEKETLQQEGLANKRPVGSNKLHRVYQEPFRINRKPYRVVYDCKRYKK